MNKDVIYIDVDDDVTAIIGKIKQAKEKIVALVPPKRVGSLQSAVNLRLLERMAKADKKQLVLITNNQALVALAANAQIPVAKNLQSKPEVAEIPAIIVDDGGDDIIDGSELPVGDHARGTVTSAKPSRSDAIDEIDVSDLSVDDEPVAVSAVGAAAVSAARKKPAKKGPKIPNFDSFRKKLVLIIIGAIGLIALLVWMFVFVPAAKVIITASTEPQPVSATVKLGGTAATDYKAGVVSSTSQQDKKDESVSFEATGQQDNGNKATGTVRFSTTSIPALGTIPAGTTLKSASGASYTTDEAVTLTISNAISGVTVGITAAGSGTSYNGATGSMTGAPSGVSAVIVGSTSGGTTNIVKVVSADDIDRARGQLLGQSTDDQKKALKAKFTNGEVVIDSSFTVDRGTPVSTPALGQEAPDGKAKLTIPTTYTIQAVAKSELDTYLKASITSKIDATNQKIFSTGIDTATLSDFQKAQDGSMTAKVNATGRIGPQINESQIKDLVKGKRYGEVQQALESQNGIKSVDVQFSYFWVRTVPNNTSKITIEFKVENE